MQEAGRIVTNRDSPVPRASVGEVFVMTFIMAAVSGLGAVCKHMHALRAHVLGVAVPVW
jgi:hypothetical protein